jgi:preprotein translocase subunit Sss1
MFWFNVVLSIAGIGILAVGGLAFGKSILSKRDQ